MKDKYKTLIISCWVVLLCCFVIKLLGGNFFEIVCKNERFVNLCLFIDSNILKYIFNFTLYMLGGIIYLLAVIKKKTTFKEKTFLIISLLIVWSIKLIFHNLQILLMVIEFAYLILIPLLFNNKCLKWSIIGCVLNLSFQIISLLTKNISLGFIDNSTLIVAIFSIDYYIMIILFYLYRTKEAK